MTSTSYEVWVFDQLEPDSRHDERRKSYGRNWDWGDEPRMMPKKLTPEEDEKKQNEYLKSKGIDFVPKK